MILVNVNGYEENIMMEVGTAKKCIVLLDYVRENTEEFSAIGHQPSMSGEML